MTSARSTPQRVLARALGALAFLVAVLFAPAAQAERSWAPAVQVHSVRDVAQVAPDERDDGDDRDEVERGGPHHAEYAIHRSGARVEPARSEREGFSRPLAATQAARWPLVALRRDVVVAPHEAPSHTTTPSRARALLMVFLN